MLAICNIDTHDIHLYIRQIKHAYICDNYYIIIVLLHNYYIQMRKYVSYDNVGTTIDLT